jgi:phosphoketolase
MLGYKNLITEVGHHAPGFYSTVFMDRSLEAMGIHTVQELCDRFPETHGLLGHLSGQIPWPAEPRWSPGAGATFRHGRGQTPSRYPLPRHHWRRRPGRTLHHEQHRPFPHRLPQATNFLPILVWNGYSQEHHSMVATQTNDAMVAYWRGNGFKEVILVDAKDFDDANQPGAYVDSTAFSLSQRLAFTQAVLAATTKPQNLPSAAP